MKQPTPQTPQNINPGATRALIVLSGGQDSVTTFLIAAFDPTVEIVGAVHFKYGQRHDTESIFAEMVCNRFGVPFTVVELPVFALLGDSALVDGSADIAAPHRINPNLPASFVPGRNLVMLTTAAAMAVKWDCTEIHTGVCETDYSGYPDCRHSTIQSLETAINLGIFGEHTLPTPGLRIVTPLMFRTKAETFKIADDLGELEYILENTHTSYSGEHYVRHRWGWGGETLTPACEVRARGWDAFVAHYRPDLASR